MKRALRRRARPLLGTFVDITAWGESDALSFAMSRAFAAIERLQARLSCHDRASEISRVNNQAHRSPIAVSAHTWRVLSAALRFSQESGGAFETAVGGTFRDIERLPGRRVRFARRMRIDLGGIAKGYCIDRAVEILRRGGALAGLVNAGGDLRAFGPRSFPVQVRHPAAPSHALAWRPLRETALATSANYDESAGRWAGELRDGRTGMPVGKGISITVQAPRAMLADALTKVVSSAAAERMLARYRARAWVLCATTA